MIIAFGLSRNQTQLNIAGFHFSLVQELLGIWNRKVWRQNLFIPGKTWEFSFMQIRLGYRE